MKEDNLTSRNSSVSWMMFFIAAFTLLTFTVAVLTPPLSGPFCAGNCFEYPYHDIIDRFPRDYYWMFMAILLYIIYIPACVSLFYASPDTHRKHALSALIFAVAGALILILDYFLQLSVVQVSLMKGETDGIALITQYNPHGIFIALEELGYMMISISFLFYGLQFKWADKQKGIRIVFFAGFALSVISLLMVIMQYGLFREYIYEIAVISIVWLIMIISGIMLGIYFRRSF